MKKIVSKISAFLALVMLVLVGLNIQTQAQFPAGNYVNNFAVGTNTVPFAGTGSVASWIYWYNTPGGNSPITNDVTTPDPLGGAGAGSLEIYNPFGTNGTQNVFFGTFGNGGAYDFSTEVNLLDFDTISCDVFVGSNQIATNSSGNYGGLQFGIINNGYGFEGFSSVNIPANATNTWVHLTVPVDHTQPNLSNVPGLAFDYNNYGGYPTNTFTFWLGDVVMHYNPAPPPPPTNYLNGVVPGLTQFADKQPSYNRQDVRSDMSGTAQLSWIGREPVTYSWTIASFPSSTYSNFLAGFTLTPDAAAGENYSDPDWSATNALWIALENNADGTATIGAAWKTNQPSGNGQLFATNGGQLLPYNNETNGLTVPSAIGTWSVTFTTDTNFTLTAPNGATTNLVLPPFFASMFNGYVGAYLYSSPTVNANVGQYCTFSKYKITGVGTPVNENFTSGGIVSPFLILNSQNYFYTGDYETNPPDQVFVTSSDAYWLHWTLPDNGYSPITGSNLLTRSSWTTLSSSNVFTSNGQHYLKIRKSDLPSSTEGLFGEVSRTFTQLQVLLPGETNAPNTPSGKTGTPTPQSISGTASTGTTVTINACDANWNIVNTSGDSISLASSDLSALLPSPVALTAGTETQTVFFGTTGSQTITASDQTNTNIVSNTDTVTITP